MQRFNNLDDFEASIRIFPKIEGGRNGPTFNCMRWDFCYAEDDPRDTIWMVYPDFLDNFGASRPEDKELPIGEFLPAKMFILVDEMREKVHRSRVKVGTQFFCHEGQKRVAEGKITKITHLFDIREPS